MEEEYGTIRIPKSLKLKLLEYIKDTDFKSIDEYIVFVLEEVMKDENEEIYSEEDEIKVKERLKALGYLG